MSRILMPDDYRRASGYRHSTAVAVPKGPKAYGAPEWGSFDGLTDPRLVDFFANGRATASGAIVNERVAMRNSALFRGVSLIASSMGMLPLQLMERKPDGSTEKARTHPLFNLLHRKPNSYQTASEFKSFMQSSALLDGNAYALIIRSRGRIVQLIPLKRGTVTPQLSESWELTFKYNRPHGGQTTLAAEDVFHFRAPISVDGLRGLSLFDIAAEAIGLAATAEKAAARIFKRGAIVGGVLQTDKRLGDEAFAHLKETFSQDYAGPDGENAGGTPVLEEGLKYQSVAGTAKESQHLEMRKFQAEELARILGVPRPLLMFDETSWGSGIEQLGLFFVTYCLMPWFVAWEEAVWRSLLTPAEQDRYFAKFNEGALLRGSLEAQATFFAKALGQGGTGAWMAPDEVRENFNLNKIPGGDALATPAPPVPPKDPTNA